MNLNHTPAQNLTDKYKLISSRDVIDFMESKHFTLTDTKVTKTKVPSKIGHQKHFLVFENPQLNNIEGLKYQLLVTNSYDGSTSFKLDFGVFRLICSNGLVIGNVFESIRQSHTGQFNLNDIIEQFVLSIPKIKESIERMKGTSISHETKVLLTKQMYELRDLKGKSEVLKPRRFGDTNNDLFSYFNVVQENMMKGGFLIEHPEKQMTARKLSVTSESIKLNKELFNKAFEYSV